MTPPEVPPYDEREIECGRCKKPYTQRRWSKTEGWPAPLCQPCIEKLDAQVQKTERRDRMQTKYGTLEIPPLYADEGFDTWEFHGPASEKAKQEQAIRDAMNYVNKWPLVPSVVVFVGGPGTGKGHLAWAMTVALCEAHELYAKFTNVPDLMRDLRESWGRSDSPPESEKLKTYREPDLLVVDEVSSHAFYGEPSRHLYDLVNFRIEWLRPTILTTNETPDDFAEMLGPALTSRLAGQSGLWDFGSHDYRLVR